MIRKAVIPIAGLGTRMAAVTGGLPKALLPLTDAHGRSRPVLYHLMREAAAAGADDVCLVVSPWQSGHIAKCLRALGEQAPDGRETEPAGLWSRARLVAQPSPKGFGDAVAAAEEFVGGEPFLLLLGDTLHLPTCGEAAPAAQVAACFKARAGASAVVGMQVVGEDQLALVGVATGEPLGGGLYRCTAVAEKPSPEEARARFACADLPAGRFLAHAGIYAFSPEIFSCLREVARGAEAASREVGLTEAQALLLAARPGGYYLCTVAGETFDAGSPAGYKLAMDAFGSVTT
jgi:UTP--glucose-1-phosphate uridylyltransferase